jgi:hypothetical protein
VRVGLQVYLSRTEVLAVETCATEKWPIVLLLKMTVENA